MRTYKILSALLSYPTEELCEAAREFPAVLRAEGLLPDKELATLEPLLRDFEEKDLFDLQERYVLLFDRTRSLSLHLFEHVHGESRDRGQAMVDLGKLYVAHGLEISVQELPDHLPMFLEFLSLLDSEEARQQLCEPLHIISALRNRMEKRESVYASVFFVLERLAGAKPSGEEVEAILREPEDDPNDGEALDRIWEEEQVRFGPDHTNSQTACPKIGDMLSRMGAAPNARPLAPSSKS